MDAIGQMDYPGSPAVDVLWRHGQIDDQRRAEAKKYIDSLTIWLSNKSLEDAVADQPEYAKILAKIYNTLGVMNDKKRWLVMCLRKTLKEHAYTPWDFAAEHN
ncbi:MAG: hypothetical protein P1S60_15270, partial [Anaerolineae bacterium]|nr:hypothetical protein [Anaerolineae bacterium]